MLPTMALVESPCTIMVCGCTSCKAVSTAGNARLVMPASVCPGVIKPKSRSAFNQKPSIAWANISLC